MLTDGSTPGIVNEPNSLYALQCKNCESMSQQLEDKSETIRAQAKLIKKLEEELELCNQTLKERKAG